MPLQNDNQKFRQVMHACTSRRQGEWFQIGLRKARVKRTLVLPWGTGRMVRDRTKEGKGKEDTGASLGDRENGSG